MSLLSVDKKVRTHNIGFYASWAGHCNISYLQIPASVPADEYRQAIEQIMNFFIINWAAVTGRNTNSQPA